MAESDPIQHVVVLMLENRSFDRVLGACQRFKNKIDGIPPGSAPRANRYDGKTYRQEPGASRVVVDDPMHETPHVLAQLRPDSGGLPAGFVEDYAKAYHTLSANGRGEVMKYYDVDTLPATHALARHFLVCDHWFSSVPGPTWANRLFAMSGTSLGHVGMPEGIMNLNLHWYDQRTLFDRLDEKGIDWRVYFGDTPLSLLLVHQWEPRNRAQHKPMTQFFKDLAGEAKEFPRFAFIEPAYLEPGANDGHPPHDVLASEELVASVYNALRANEPLWAHTLLVILCDEHGGFYDHVSPPAAVPPDRHREEYDFNRLGVRVPAILVSPWVENDVLSETFDHTSLLKYLSDKWGLGPLGERTARAKTFAGCFTQAPRTDTPNVLPSVPPTVERVQSHARQKLTGHESALIALSHALESMSEEDPATIAARSRQVLSGPQSQIDAAFDRVEAFLKRGSVELLRTVE